MPARLEVDRADDLRAGDRDERSVERPGCGSRLDVDGRLRGDPVALFRDCGEDGRHRESVVLVRRADLERRVRHRTATAFDALVIVTPPTVAVATMRTLWPR